MNASGPATVRDILALLHRWHVRLLAGERGLARTVSWANLMRARLPAFAGFQGGELALCSMTTLRSLRSQLGALSLASVVDQLADTGVSAIAVAGLDDPDALTEEDTQALAEAQARADAYAMPLLALPASASLPEIENEVVALVLMRRERQPATREPADLYAAQFRATLRGEALDALLSGTYAGEAQMRARAAQLGHDLTQPYAVLRVELDVSRAESGEGAAAPPGHMAAVASELAETLTVAVGAWALAQSATVVALAPLAKEERGIAGVAERIQTLLARTLGGDEAWAAGLGEPAIGPLQLRRSATEAHDAARLGLIVLGTGRLARPSDLGVYRLLLALRDSDELAPFVAQVLAPLDGDARSGDALLETLEAFFLSNGNLSEAARRLHLHRNSLLYRLRRASELLGKDLDDAELRLALQLALKGRRVLAM